MIVDAILLVLQGVLSILLSPLTVINIGVDFVSSIPIFMSFLQVVAYILPWSNILPLILLSLALVGFKIVIAVLKTLWSVIPFV